MIKGTSSENPADERFLLMDHIWSAYDVTGELTMNSGAICVMIHLRSDMILGLAVSKYSISQFGACAEHAH